jgi:hypothetical protein
MLPRRILSTAKPRSLGPGLRREHVAGILAQLSAAASPHRGCRGRPKRRGWRDENIRATEAYRARADAGTPSTWRAYEEAFDREHEALMR